MNWIISGIILISIIFSGYGLRLHRKKTAQKFLASIPENDDETRNNKLLYYSIIKCCNTVTEMLGSMISGDKTGVCKVNRLFAIEYNKFEAYNSTVAENNKGIYLSYLWEATLKITESGRRVIVNPDYSSDIFENNILATWINNISKLSETYSLNVSVEQLDKASLVSQIRQYTEGMYHEDYEDGCQKYNFLTFLYYLHSFVNSVNHLTNNKNAA